MRSTTSLHRRYIYVSILVFIVFLSGCSSKGTSTIEVSPNASATEVISPTTPILTQAPTAESARTLVPYFTPTPRMITPAPAEGTVIDNAMVSPDGEWTALPIYENLSNGYKISLQIFNKGESIVWTPVDTKGEGLGYLAPSPRRWSADSRYFYFVESRVSDGCADFSPVEDAWQRVDVQTGEVTQFELPAGRGHQISSDETMLAYTTLEAPLELVVLNLTDQTEKRVVLLPDEIAEDMDAQGGRIVWSPDGTELILAVQIGNICEGQTPEFSLQVVQVEDMKVRALYQGEDFLSPLTWDETEKILVKDWSLRSWWIDAVDGAVTTAP